MTATLVLRIGIVDPARWRAYRDTVMPVIAAHGGAHLPGAGAAELLEGVAEGQRIVLFAFPSMDAIRAFWRSPEYAPVKEMRRGAATLEAWAVPGSHEGDPHAPSRYDAFVNGSGASRPPSR